MTLFATRITVSVVLPALLLISLHSCMTFRESPRKIKEFFRENEVKGAIRHFTAENIKMEYAEAGDSTKPLILFVHGSPGSLSAFLWYLVDSTLLEHGHLITMDRPGFGHSNFGVGEPSLDKQANIIKTLVELHPTSRPVILVGHSLGGPLIAKLAIDHPHLIDGLVVIAGSMDPDLEPNEMWFRAPLATPFLSWILPRSFRASNEELYQLKPQLQDMVSSWRKITCPVAIIHGKKDAFVPYGNVAFAEKVLVNAKVHYFLKEDSGHFIPWQDHDLVVEGILEVLNDTKSVIH